MRIFLILLFLFSSFEVYFGELAEVPEVINASSNTFSEDPNIAIDQAGTIHVIWEEGAHEASNIYYSYRQKGETEWHTPEDISHSDYASQLPTIAVGSDGKVHSIWSEAVVASGNNGEVTLEMYHSWMQAGSSLPNWTTPNLITISQTLSRTSWRPDLAAGQNGEMHLVWWSSDNYGANTITGTRYSIGEVHYLHWEDEQWQGYEQLSTGTNHSATPAIAVDDTGLVHVAWNNAEPTISYKKYSTISQTIVGSEIISTNVTETNVDYGYRPYTDLTVGPDGQAYLVWYRLALEEDGNGNVVPVEKLSYTEGGLTGWSGKQDIFTVIAEGVKLPCRVAYGEDGAVHVVTNQLLDNEQNAFYARIGEKAKTSPTLKHYYANGQRIATRVDNDLYYIVSDHLGSTTLVADDYGNQVGYAYYDPYGTILTNTLPATLTDRLFTGQRWDAITNLYDYRARAYDPATGSFIQPDSIVADAFNPAAWNRYSYVYGNPVNYTDPTGHIACGGLCIGTGLFVLGAVGGHLAATSAGYEVGSSQWYGAVGLGGAIGVGSGGLGGFAALGLGIVGDTFVDTAILGDDFGPSLGRSVIFGIIPDADGFPFTGVAPRGFKFSSNASMATVASRQRAFWEKHGFTADILGGGKHKIVARAENLGAFDWCGQFNCGKYADFFGDTYSDSAMIIRKRGGGNIQIDNIVVGHTGVHAVSVDRLGRVWDVPTNTWGQSWGDYTRRFGYSSSEFYRHFSLSSR